MTSVQVAAGELADAGVGVDADAGAGTAVELEKDQRKGQGVVVLGKRHSGQLDRPFYMVKKRGKELDHVGEK